MKDEDIKRAFEPLKAPESSVERLQASFSANITNKHTRGGYYSAFAAFLLLFAILTVSTVSANKGTLQKYKKLFMDYFYGSETGQDAGNGVREDSETSAEQEVAELTDGKVRTKRIGDFRLTIYDTFSIASAENKINMGCMYYSVEFVNPNSEYVIAVFEGDGRENPKGERYFSKDGEMSRSEVKNSAYKKYIDMDLEYGDSGLFASYFNYDEKASSDGKYYFALRWFGEGGDLSECDQVCFSLFDYAIKYDKDGLVEYGELEEKEAFYRSNNHINFNYHADLEEKVFLLSDGYLLGINAIGAYLTRRTSVTEKDAWKENDSKAAGKIARRYEKEVESLCKSVQVEYDGNIYDLSEMASFQSGGNYRVNVYDCYRWTGAACFFEKPIDISKIEEAY